MPNLLANHVIVCPECWKRVGLDGSEEITLGLVQDKPCFVCNARVSAQGEYHWMPMGDAHNARLDYHHKFTFEDNVGLTDELTVKVDHGETNPWIEAMGLVSTIVPDMIVDASDPVGMAQKVVKYVGLLKNRGASDGLCDWMAECKEKATCSVMGKGVLLFVCEEHRRAARVHIDALPSVVDDE